MKYIEVPQFGGFDQLQMREGDAPTPGQGEILIDVRASGINFADIFALTGQYPPVPKAPYRPGFEVAGEVSALGEGVENWKVGDRAVAFVKGGFAEQAVASVGNAAPIPAKLDFADAPALLVQGLTAFYLFDRAPLREGETVLLSSAAGGVGTLAIQIAKIEGAKTVIGLASPRGHDRVRELGAEPVNYREKGWSAKVKELAPDGVDVFLDSIGALDGEGFETLASGARWMYFGVQGDSDAPLRKKRAFEMLFKSMTLRGFVLSPPQQGDVQRGLKQLSQWIDEGNLEVKNECRYPLADVRQAFEDITNRKTHGKVVLEP